MRAAAAEELSLYRSANALVLDDSVSGVVGRLIPAKDIVDALVLAMARAGYELALEEKSQIQVAGDEFAVLFHRDFIAWVHKVSADG